MSKGLSAGVLSAAADDSQRVYWAVEIDYTAPLRICNTPVSLAISGDTYYNWSMSVSEISTKQGLVENVSIRAENGDLTPTGMYSGQMSELVLSEDPRGLDVTIYRVTDDSGGTQYESTWYSGTITEASEGIDAVSWSGITASRAATQTGTNRETGECRWRQFKGTDCGMNGARTAECARNIKDCRTMINAADQVTGSGLDDVTSSGDYTGGKNAAVYRLKISSTGTPDQFTWKKSLDDGSSFGTESAGIAMTGAAQAIENGLSVTWAATTGHTLNNEWDIQASNARRYGALNHAPLAGATVTINGVQEDVREGPKFFRFMHRQRDREQDVTVDDLPEPTVDDLGRDWETPTRGRRA